MSGEFSDTGNMSPIIVENMVMANIIVTPEKKTSNEREYWETIILRQKPVSWIGSIHTCTYRGGKFIRSEKKQFMSAEDLQKKSLRKWI